MIDDSVCDGLHVTENEEVKEEGKEMLYKEQCEVEGSVKSNMGHYYSHFPATLTASMNRK